MEFLKKNLIWQIFSLLIERLVYPKIWANLLFISIPTLFKSTLASARMLAALSALLTSLALTSFWEALAQSFLFHFQWSWTLYYYCTAGFTCLWALLCSRRLLIKEYRHTPIWSCEYSWVPVDHSTHSLLKTGSRYQRLAVTSPICCLSRFRGQPLLYSCQASSQIRLLLIFGYLVCLTIHPYLLMNLQ